MAHNVYVKATALSNANGRIDYITNEKRQEHLVAFYHSTDDATYWTDLSAHCQEQSKHSKSKKACEGREFIGKLDNQYAELYKENPRDLAKRISHELKKLTGTENVVALHWNKSKTNLHYHAIVSENKEINEVSYGAELKRNTYYDQAGKRSTKAKCTDENGELLRGCKFYKKGERIETVKRFGSKENIRDHELLNTIKERLATMHNQDLSTDKFKVFKEDGMHLKQQHVGKGSPKPVQSEIKQKNQIIKEWNRTVDNAIKSGVKIDGIKKYRNDFKTTIKNKKDYSTWLEHITFIGDKINKFLKTKTIGVIWKRLAHNLKTVDELQSIVAGLRRSKATVESRIDVLKQEKKQHLEMYPALERVGRKLFGKKKKVEELEEQYNLAVVSEYYDKDNHDYRYDISHVTSDIDNKLDKLEQHVAEHEQQLKKADKGLRECYMSVVADKEALRERVNNPHFQKVLEDDFMLKKISYDSLCKNYGRPDKTIDKPTKEKRIYQPKKKKKPKDYDLSR